MRRTAVVLLALTLAAAQGAALLCGVLCHSAVAPSGAASCAHDTDEGDSMVPGGTCDELTIAAAPAAHESARRTFTPSSEAPGSRGAAPAVLLLQDLMFDRRPAGLLSHRPLIVALRI